MSSQMYECAPSVYMCPQRSEEVLVSLKIELQKVSSQNVDATKE